MGNSAGDAANGIAGRHAVEQLLERVLFAPLDLTARAVDDLPATVERARQQLVLARFVGKLAVDQGVREVRRRIEAVAADLAPEPTGEPDGDRTEDGAGAADDDEGSERDEGVPAPTPTGETPTHVDPVGPGDLALPDYEQLPAVHIVAKLPGLTADELDAVESFEQAHRNRRTVLGKIEQLRQ